jgi:hypothetical protein
MMRAGVLQFVGLFDFAWDSFGCVFTNVHRSRKASQR